MNGHPDSENSSSRTVPTLKGQMQPLGVEEGQEHLDSQCFRNINSRQWETIL